MRLLVIATVSAVLAAAPAARAQVSNREARPFTIAAAASAVMPSVGLDVSQQLGSRVAIGAQLTTLLVHNDLSLRSRFFVLGWQRAGVYLGANLHGWLSPIILSKPTVLASAELGYEWRGDGGFTVGFGAGVGALRVPSGSEGAGNRATHWDPVPMFNLRIGSSS